MKITTNQILKITEEAIDKIESITKNRRTSFLSAMVTSVIEGWLRSQGIEVVDEEEAG